VSDKIRIVGLASDVLKSFTAILDEYFPLDVSYYQQMPIAEYRRIVLNAQNEMNRINGSDLVSKSILGELLQFVDASEVLIQSNLYLRAARPDRLGMEESIGWHRESFYGPEMTAAANVWTPLRGVTERNTIRYIPGSSVISDDDIETVAEPSQHTERFSDGHRIGFLYSPKKIVKGVDLSRHQPLPVNIGQTAIFDGSLVHGAAVNQTEGIRFSIDFRAIAAHKYSDSHKKIHFASGRAYFRSIN
jgi:hypothetical protein